jgi:2-C-methyl-D-erythritol 4-phosphate cytidylyltransferase
MSIPELNNTNLWVVIPAAGYGERMQSSTPKQYLPLAGKPMLAHTVEAMLAFEPVTGVQLSLAAEDRHWDKLGLTSDTKEKLLPPTIGGATRAASVLSGLVALESLGASEVGEAVKIKQDDWVMVHDAARPCIDKHCLERMITELGGDDVGGILALPVADTIKSVSGNHIDHTVDREPLWAAQTPQMFRFELLKNSLEKALSEKLNVTDEASAIELSGFSPKVVLGSPKNIKVTYPEDISLAEKYLS